MLPNSNNYEILYNSITHKLSDCDFSEIAPRLGFELPIDNTLTMCFVGREFKINQFGVFASDGMPSDPNIRSTIIYYVTSKGCGEPSYSYKSPHAFIHSSTTGAKMELEWMTSPLIRKYKNDIYGLGAILHKIGADYDNKPNNGIHKWTYRVLPKIPMQIIFMEADDEFPCEINLMLDESADKFMEFEQLAFLCGCFVKSILILEKLT
ncbi:MAG: DUF3786 domain-containing protein [Oscillospiraceae bacterium]|nr:DUF3786 domain-containing protein [Oscillospiraceae bacterium]